jgi:hypothetical protein
MMVHNRTLVLLLAMVLACLPLCALALDREEAIEIAKKQTKSKCASKTPCTFSAKLENNKWYVQVEFPDRGGHAAFILDQTGKVVGRMESE